MTDVIAGQSAALISQWYDYEGGSLVDLDATPTITITSIATGAPAVATTSTGVTHPGTGTYGYLWTPASSLTPGAYLAVWAGLKDAAPLTATESLTVTAAAGSRVYATVQEYEADAGPAPEGTAARLRTASRMLDRIVLRFCLYDTDSNGAPAHPLVAGAFREAVCAQVRWWSQVGDPSGADAVGWNSVGIGSVTLSRPENTASGEGSSARQVAPEAWDALLSPDLTPDIFRMGAVASC